MRPYPVERLRELLKKGPNRERGREGRYRAEMEAAERSFAAMREIGELLERQYRELAESSLGSSQ